MLSNRHILTAAHCVDGATSGTVIVGAHFISNTNEPNQRRIAFGGSDFTMHEAWDPSVIRNDVAIVRTPTVFVLNQFVVPVGLPRTDELNESFAGENGVVSGWGVFSDSIGSSSDVLRFVYDNIMTNTACTIRFPGVIQPSNICVTGTSGRGACSGDSGKKNIFYEVDFVFNSQIRWSIDCSTSWRQLANWCCQFWSRFGL